MTKAKRPIDVLVDAFDLHQRRKFTLKNEAGEKVLDLYFRAITRADRKKAQQFANSEDALDMSTHMLCQMAEHEDGTKVFDMADVHKLQRSLPETVLNELELFLFGVNASTTVDKAKKA